MEIAAISNIHHASPNSTPTKSGVDEVPTTSPASQAVATCKYRNEENSAETNTSITVSEDRGSIPLNSTAHNVDKKTSSSLSRNSSTAKLACLKEPDRLTRAIEACKKLHKLPNQSTVDLQLDSTSSVPSGVAESDEPLNGVTSGTDTSEPVSEASVNLPRSSEDDLYLMSNNTGNDSSSSSLNSTNLSQFVNEDSSTPSSQIDPEFISDLALKKFLFLFRPSDHEVLVQNKGVNLYRCNVCGGVYRQKFSLKRHFLRTHINFRFISKSDISNCKIAVPNEFIPQDSSADCKTPYGSKCRKKFKSSNAIFLENNKSRVMPGLYICHICGDVRFDLENELRDHYNTHSDAERKKFQCNQCSASFFKKQILSRHLASHGERVYRKSCKKCGAEFSAVIEYQKHALSHSSGRVCRFCSKILSTGANRKRHESLHLGLKPFPCAHCRNSFAQSKDLDRHLKKQHSGLCYFCEVCNKLFTYQASLDVHIHEKHSGISPKKAEKSSSPEPGNKSNVATPQSGPVSVPVKLKICFVCKRSFPTFYAMMKHRTQAHPYHTKRRKNRKTMKQKLEQSKQAAAKDQGTKARKPYGRPPKQNSNFPTSTVRRGRPPLDRSVKFGAPYDRTGSRFLTKRDKELAKKEEVEFYCSLSGNIAENLLHHLDGKTQQLSLKQNNFSDIQFPSCNFEERGRFPWSNYNFPNGYDVDHALNTRGHEVRNNCPENLSNRDKCLLATGLNRVQKLPQTTKNADSDKQVEPLNGISETDRKKLDLEERKKLIGRKVDVISVCGVCNKIFESNDTYSNHFVNNHTNVYCTCIEIEGNKDPLPGIVEDLCKQKVTPDGMYFSSNVPPPLSNTCLLKCTKCKSVFKTSRDLHTHIIECGNLMSSPCHVWKRKTQKRIKRTMRSRMSLARQQAAVKAYGEKLKTPEKRAFSRNDALAKSNEKVSKSAEKSQFYKSGRLQTTSFTVDMNYFKTKPVKPPANSQSKRGRKSYASLSYRYRNASMQSSASECPHCKEAFPSQSALNIHIQHHCIYSVSKQNDKTHCVTDLSSRMTNVPSVNNISTAGSSFSSWDKSRKTLDDNSLKNSSDKSPPSQSANSVLLMSKAPCDYAKEAMKDPLVSKSDKGSAVVDLKNFDTLDIPIDLSKPSDVETCVTINLSNRKRDVTSSGKSALEIAMEAIEEYYQNSEQNEHISKLQKTVEKLATSSQVASSQVQKTVTAKKVGRPKKVKRQSPYYLKKNLSSVKNIEHTNSQPISKLEETVKRLTESKFKSDTHKKQNASPFKTIEAAKNSTHAEKKSDVPSTINVVQPIFRTPDKDTGKSPSPTAFTTATSITLSVTNNFVPLIIYGDQSKSNNALLLTTISPNKGKLPQSQNISNCSVASPSPAKTDSISQNAIASDINLSPGKTSKNTCEVNSLIDASNTTDSPDKKSEKTRLSSGSQGRISPSLESIVNSIKQKLHSQEQEYSPQDDVVISWLEDEKFEIPSCSKLVLPTNSSSNSPLSVDNEPFCPISEDTSPDKEKSESIEILKSPPESPPKIAIDDSCEKNEFASSVSRKIESLLVGSISSPKIEAKIKMDNKHVDSSAVSAAAVEDNEVLYTGSTPANDIAHVQSIQNGVSIAQGDHKDSQNPFVGKLTRNKVKTFTPADPKPCFRKDSDPQSQNLIRKKPGRPKKKTVKPNIDASVSECTKDVKSSNFDPSETDLEDAATISNLVISTPSVQDAISVEIGTELNVRDLDKGSIHSDSSKIEQQADVSTPELSHIQDLSNIVDPEYEDFRNLPSCSTVPDVVNALFEDNLALSKMSTLRAFRTKSKQNQPADSEIIPAIETKITSEFGKNLASRMKEKMRLSFEIAASESMVRSEECNNSDGVPDTSDVNSLMSDDESEFLEIKKEIDGLEPSKKHSCPFCMLEFAYLTNFRRHLRLCRARLETKEVEPVPSTSTTVLQYLPKKDEVEHSMLNLLRHQSRQTQMLKEAEKSSGSKVESKFRTYSCSLCHRIYLSLFKLLQHQLTHKLESDSVGASTELDDTKDITDIDKYSVNELDECGVHGSEIITYIDPVDAKLMNVNKSLETLSSLNDKKELKPDSSIPGVNQKLLDDEVKKKHISDVIEDVVEANNGSEGIQLDALENPDSTTVSIKTEEQQPVKRKRGRPFGWRKDTSVTGDNVTSKVSRNNFKSCNKATTVRFGIKRKAGKLLPGPIKRGHKKLFSRKMGVKTGNSFTNRMKDNSISHKPFDFTAADELSSNIVPYDETVAPKTEVSDISMLENPSLMNKKKPTKSFKRTLMKDKSISNITLDGIKNATQAVSPKSPQKIKIEPKVSSPIIQSKNLNPASMKRHKGPSIVSKEDGSIVIKSEFPLKRRPGRPSKTLQSPTASTSSQTQPGSARRLGKMVSRTDIVDSSDSEYDVSEKQDTISKRRACKICPICKGKFSASLALHRHIQLVHSRRSKPVELKTEMPSTPKAVKRIIPISPVSSLNSYESKDVKKSSQNANDKLDDIQKAPQKVFTNSVDAFDLDTASTKVIKNNAKSPSSINAVRSKRMTKSPKPTVNVNDDNDFHAHAKLFKKVVSRSPRVKSNATSPKVVKKLNAKSAANDNSDVDITKVSKKGVATSIDVSSEANSSKVVGKLPDKSTADENFGADSTSFKKSISKELSITSGASSSKVMKKRAAKSISANSSNNNSPKIGKKSPPKFVTVDSSDADSTKSFKKDVSKPAVINFDVIGPKIFKKRITKSAGDSNSDTDSSKSFRKGLSKVLSMKFHAHSPKGVQKLAPKAAADDNSDVDSTQSSKRVISKLLSIDSDINSPKAIKKPPSKTVSDTNGTKSSKKIIMSPVMVYNSDSESVKSLRKSISKPITSYNSDPESAKKIRKAIPKSRILDNSDVDSDISVKTDVTPLRNSKMCPICKERFSAKFLLQRHIQLVHSRRTTTDAVKNTSVEPITYNSPKIQSPPVKNRKVQSPFMKIKEVKSRSMKIGQVQSQSIKIKKVQSSSMKIKRIQSPSMRMKKIQSPTTKIQKMIDAASRSALSRQCRKPLPPLKRKWSKKENPSQD